MKTDSILSEYGVMWNTARNIDKINKQNENWWSTPYESHYYAYHYLWQQSPLTKYSCFTSKVTRCCLIGKTSTANSSSAGAPNFSGALQNNMDITVHQRKSFVLWTHIGVEFTQYVRHKYSTIAFFVCNLLYPPFHISSDVEYIYGFIGWGVCKQSRWRHSVTVPSQDGGYVLLWQRYDNNKMAAMRYYSTSSTVQS